MNDAPKSVSGRVVNTVISSERPPTNVTGKCTSAPYAPADPVALHRLDAIGPVEQFEVVDQPVGVGGDAHHPLAHAALEHGEVAAVAAAVGGDLLVGDDGAEPGAPVDRRLADVGEAVVVDDVGALTARQVGPGDAVRCRPCAGLELGDSSAIGRARSRSWSYQALKTWLKIHCVHR